MAKQYNKRRDLVSSHGVGVRDVTNNQQGIAHGGEYNRRDQDWQNRNSGQKQAGSTSNKRSIQRPVEHADSAWLVIVLEHLRLYFNQQICAQDLEILGFSLHQLFCCVDTLYQVALAEPPSSGTTQPPAQLSTQLPAQL